MRVFIACLGTETNTFSSLPTGEQTYRDTAVFDGDATRHEPNPFSLPLHIWRKRAEETATRSSRASAPSPSRRGGPSAASTRAIATASWNKPKLRCRSTSCSSTCTAPWWREGYDDCEGDLLARLRAVAGPDAVIGGELDLHCHITPEMLEAATALITYKEYPHIDIGERAEDLFGLCHDAAEGRTRPVMAAHDCRMISMWRTTGDQMRAFVADMKAREGRDGVLAVSFGHGFPWGDVAEWAPRPWWWPMATRTRRPRTPPISLFGSGRCGRRRGPARWASTRRSTARWRPRAGRSCSRTSPTTRAAGRRAIPPSS